MSNFHSAGQALQKFLQRLISSLPCSRGHQAFLWACDLPICPVTTCQSLSVSLPINNLERVTFWYINSIWDSPDRSPSSWITGGWFMARHKHWWILPPWPSFMSASFCQSKLQASPQTRLVLTSLAHFPRRRGICLCIHPSLYLANICRSNPVLAGGAEWKEEKWSQCHKAWILELDSTSSPAALKKSLNLF